MTEYEPAVFPWLMDDSYLSAAPTRYSIKLQGKKQTTTLPKCQRSPLINGLLVAKNGCDWLKALVAFAQDQGEHTRCHRAQMELLSDAELQHLYRLFDQADYITLINSVLLYKGNPHALYQQHLHPEKLVSVQTRLALLHAFIVFMHRTVIQLLRQHGFNADHDYLVHGRDMPPGVSIANASSCRESIALAIKEWRLSRLIDQEDDSGQRRLDELFDAYKFRFNPCRLIDAVMLLQIQLKDSRQTEVDQHHLFASHVCKLFSQLSSDDCLDLYGYFSNKNSCYLMRSLLAVLNGQGNAYFPVFGEQDKQAIRRVYFALDSVMNGLREELQRRHISTEAYARHIDHELKPGRRIIFAIKRITQVYAVDHKRKNERMDQLFDELDASTRG